MYRKITFLLFFSECINSTDSIMCILFISFNALDISLEDAYGIIFTTENSGTKGFAPDRETDKSHFLKTNL